MVSRGVFEVAAVQLILQDDYCTIDHGSYGFVIGEARVKFPISLQLTDFQLLTISQPCIPM